MEGGTVTIRHAGEEITLTAKAPTITRPTPPAVSKPEPDLEARGSARSNRNAQHSCRPLFRDRVSDWERTL